ncbi:MurR/RpiR family transcriptional regulator [Rossellomorea vietnamensis]|uniref:MurR/RpiR family transcriptional regulator n=1 Tax=Rossellomorea vietnamensis TaxID=218284 RepID=UPI00054DC51E|nr:MurR/RpiR family transcriptional regulator [Rossellomorea vietnamensis]MCC5801053.1 MurR/RpiR family transcriptional regulator [Rossellomorea vietnamensis]
MTEFQVLKHIKSQMESFTPSEIAVAQYVLEFPEKVMEMTTKQLSHSCGSSEAAIIRFCKRIGINSFSGLKIELAKSTNIEETKSHDINTLLSFEDNLETVFNKVLVNTYQAIKNTEKLFSIDELGRAVNAFHEAERVYLYGVGGSAVVAEDFTQKLLRLNYLAFQASDIHIQMMMAANLTERDVLFVVSTSGQTKEILKLMNVAQEKGATIVLLTQHGKSPARKLADIVLTISEEEHNIRIGTMTARIAQLVVIDALFVALCMKKGHGVYEQIIHTHEVVQRMKEEEE